MIDVRCPICDLRMQGASPREWPEFPFCSRRCKVIDLGRWLGEAYSVHQESQAEGEETVSPEPDEDIP
ncbi:MAG: DNA gyrase inhibitor YacG [Planctomycetota bacterium]|nr:MAG: DNA gyrase inhibitor YacG [Planctomycetota bacterium]